jgi:branched-chain amino acid transport system substrate-binding protein
MLKGSVGLIALTSLFLSGAATAQEKIKVGVTATLEGTYTVLGEDGMRGFTLGKKIGDKELDYVVASTDATPDSAVPDPYGARERTSAACRDGRKILMMAKIAGPLA